MFKQYSATVGNDTITIETGKLAQQAGGAVTVRLGDAVIFVAATGSPDVREGTDFFPLTVDLEERRYASGKIPGGFFKREGRPSTEGTLIMRLIDRPLRPLFPEGYRNDVQVVAMPLSADFEHQLDVIAMIGASAALMISDIPFDGPIGAVRVGYINGAFVANPTESQLPDSQLDLVVAGTAESVMMVEAGAREFPDDLMVDAIRFGHEAMQPIIALQSQMRAEIGKPKVEGTRHVLAPQVLQKVEAVVGQPLKDLVAAGASRGERHEREQELLKQLLGQLDEETSAADAREAYEYLLKKAMRDRILDTGVRIDGRDLDTIRPLSAEVGLVPRTHGSALFNRGETQVLNLITLGTGDDEQRVELVSGGEATLRYMHHYNFPPYSTGEARPLRGPRRREIGHGALAERALIPVLPDPKEFGYTIRSVSEVMSSNGSTSMASTCASCLALLDAGVPLKAPVAGIAMGVITEPNRWAVLTDIQGLEDHLGDMDFKVTGTANGITAMQLDMKIGGLTYEIITETLKRSLQARLRILDVMNACMPGPRAEMSPYAPRIQITHIPVEKIGALIGPGGKNIRSIIEETGVSIDVDDDGTVHVASTDSVRAARALERINGLTAVAEIGRVYTGKVVRTTDFGAFVEFLPGQDGLVHISQLSDHHVPSVEDEVQVGDEIMVMVIDIDPTGRVRLSRQAVLEGWTAEEARSRDRRPSGGGGGGRDRRDDRRGGDDRRRRD
jgi:polyribonucleotide nucleotidyltransferase